MGILFQRSLVRIGPLIRNTVHSALGDDPTVDSPDSKTITNPKPFALNRLQLALSLAIILMFLRQDPPRLSR